MRLPMILLFPVLTACSDSSGAVVPPADGIRLVTVAEGLDRPVHLISPPGDARTFVVEQVGRIRIIQEGRLLDRPFLDIRGQVGAGGERGLLSVAFHPQYASNGRFFVNYTDRSGDTRIERYRVSSDPGLADATSGVLLLSVEQPYSNHNGGHILFGPDGHLYIGMGDGGSGGDPLGHGQNPATLLGALLRIDVDGGEPYRVPPNNPFVNGGGRPEVWATGLRNPWRMAFDGGTLLIADVGQNQWEEINAVPADAPGLNYGWNLMEGRHCFSGSSCQGPELTLPVHEYSHADGCSVTGGAMYRGTAITTAVGHYFYSDYCQGWLRSFRLQGGQAVDHRDWRVSGLGQVLSFGVDAAGELYVLSADGRVRRLEPER